MLFAKIVSKLSVDFLFYFIIFFLFVRHKAHKLQKSFLGVSFLSIYLIFIRTNS